VVVTVEFLQAQQAVQAVGVGKAALVVLELLDKVLLVEQEAAQIITQAAAVVVLRLLVEILA
jgi:putative flippase GtrA